MNKKIVSFIALIVLSSLSLVGCVNTTTGPANTNTAPTAQPVAASPQPAPMTNKMPATMFTLPILKAFLANDTFRADVKKRLQLTDEQLRQLDVVVTKPAGNTNSQESTESSKTSTEQTSKGARQQADERVRTILGEEKTQQLAALVEEYWKGAAPTSATPGAAPAKATTALPATPNQVPGDTRVVVNAPAYRMDVFEDGKLIKSYKVGIGYPEFPLPVGLRQAKEIIFNPTWTPPNEPWVEASNQVKVGEKVEAGHKLNPLGIAKIPIGQPSLIHGGKKPAQIGAFASHGCVGLTDAQLREFVQILADVGGKQLTSKEIADFAKDRTKTQSVAFAGSIPVELRYETMVVEDGKLTIYRDVYDMNTNTEENLRAVLAAHGVTLEQLSADERNQVMQALMDMSRDATGKLDTDPKAKDVPSKNGNVKQTDSTKKDNKSEPGKVTRTVKGAKEVAIEIAALRGKGYPAPVALNTGGAPVKTPAAQPRRKS